MVNIAGAQWVPGPPEVRARRLSATGMKELWATGSSWGADRCWCWQIERVIIQSLEDELVLVLAGSPCSRITPNHTSINQALTPWHSLKTALLSKGGHADEGCLSWKSATSDHKGCMHTWKKHGCLRPWTSVTLILTNYSNCISVTSELLAALTEV